MIDPSSSEEESDEDQSTNRGGPGGGRGANAGGHGSRRHPGGGGGGSSAGAGSGSNATSATAGLTASPGGHSQGSVSSSSLHSGSLHGPHGRALSGGQGHHASQQEAVAGAGLDVPNLSSARNSLSPSMSATQDAANYAKSTQRPTSPSPSVASEKNEVDLQVKITSEFFLFLL